VTRPIVGDGGDADPAMMTWHRERHLDPPESRWGEAGARVAPCPSASRHRGDAVQAATMLRIG